MRSTIPLALGIAVFAGAAAPVSAELIYGTTAQGFLINFDSASPNVINEARPITGLMPNELVTGLTFRETDFGLYGYTNFGRTYLLDQITAQATLVGGVMPFDGSNFGFAWDPVADNFRVVSETDHNCVISLDGNTITDQGALAYGMMDPRQGTNPNVVAAAYTNAFPGSEFTELFVIDTGLDILGRIDNPASGQITTVGNLGIDINARGGFDISGLTGIAYLGGMLQGESGSRLWTIDLATGAVTEVGLIDGGLELRTMTVVQPIPTPGSVAMFGLACVLMGARRRRS